MEINCNIFDYLLKKNIGMLCMQELFFSGGWITWNIVSDAYIFTKGKKSINAEKKRKCRVNSHTDITVLVPRIAVGTKCRLQIGYKV